MAEFQNTGVKYANAFINVYCESENQNLPKNLD